MSSKYNLHYEKIGKVTHCIEDEILFEIPSSWTWVRLGSMGVTQTGSTPSTQVRDFYGEYMPFIKPADITNSGIDYNNEKLSKKGTEVGRVAEKGSILMVCIGGSLGKCYFNDRIVSFNQQINSLTPFFSSYKFIFYYLLSSYFFEQLQDKATGTATPIVNKTSWESILIPLPPLQEQKRIVDKLEEILPLVEKYKEDKEKLDELNLSFPSKLKKSILDYAIKGKLVEQNLEDESVEILLQKIRQEKQ
uniref:restriction endonuclease subunit S n=1 Tax=Campylobacter concisus TaxID=199 RepID=UPI0021CCD0FC